jgi:hypothetical protein
MLKLDGIPVQFLRAGTRLLSVLTLGSVLASTIAVAFGADARTAAPSNLENTVLLFERQGTGLVHALDKNFYGPGNRDDALQATSKGILFDSTDSKDRIGDPVAHLAVCLLAEKARLDRTRRIGERCRSHSLLVTVQRDGFLGVVSFTPDPTRAVFGKCSMDVSIPRMARQIRLAIASADGNVARVPSKITVWSEYPRPPWLE